MSKGKDKMCISIYGQMFETTSKEVLVALVPPRKKNLIGSKWGLDFWRATHQLNMANSYEEAKELIGA